MRAAMSACSLWGLLVLLLAAPRGADAQLDGIGAKLAAMKERALQMNAEMGVRPTRTREDTEWEKITGRPLASLKGAEPAGQTHSCFDINARCSELVQKGQCTASTTAKWMAENCRRSCGICGTMTNAAPMKEKSAHSAIAAIRHIAAIHAHRCVTTRGLVCHATQLCRDQWLTRSRARSEVRSNCLPHSAPHAEAQMPLQVS